MPMEWTVFCYSVLAYLACYQLMEIYVKGFLDSDPKDYWILPKTILPMIFCWINLLLQLMYNPNQSFIGIVFSFLCVGGMHLYILWPAFKYHWANRTPNIVYLTIVRNKDKENVDVAE